MKNFKGYISSRRLIDGRYIPQKIQNLTIRITCERYNYKFVLSSTEYIFDNSFKMLENLINNYISNIDGIAFYSIFQLPLEKKLRDKYIIKILNKKKKIIFSNEKVIVNSIDEVDIVDQYINISRTILKCPDKNLLLKNYK